MDLVDVEHDLRAHLHSRPTPRAPEGLVESTRALHRQRRRTQAGVVATGLAVALLFGGVPALRAALPLPGGSDVAAPSTPARTSPDPLASLFDLPVRGPLADDTGWLTAVAALPWEADGSGPLPQTRRVAWAGDVGTERIAMLLGRGNAQAPLVTWFTGPAGAAPEQMTQVTSVSTVAQNQPLAFADVPDGASAGVLVVVGSPGDTAEYLAGTAVSADGRRQEVRQQLPSVDGVAAAEVDGPFDLSTGARVVVSRDGRRVDTMSYLSTDRADAAVQALARGVSDPRGLAARVSAAAVGAAFSSGRATYGSGLDGATPVLLTAGPTAGGGELVLIGWTFRSGATVLAAAVTEVTADGSGSSSWALDPQPAGVPLVDQPVAVLFDTDLALSGPSGAVTAEAVAPGGALLTTLALESGSGTWGMGDGPTPATVRFLDAAGTALAEVRVTTSNG